MKLGNKKNSLTREDAEKIYSDLHQRVAKLKGSKGEDVKKYAAKKKKTATAAAPRPEAGFIKPQMSSQVKKGLGKQTALSLVLTFAVMNVVFSALESVGFMKVDSLQASMHMQLPVRPAQKFSKEEIRVLTSLDDRRAELEEKAVKIEDQKHDLEIREREFAVKLTRLRDLTDTLNVKREKNSRKREGQLEQLAKVYSSMKPGEASALIGQLDMSIAIKLLERMPEKRIGQILAMMDHEKALKMTKMLSLGH